MSFDAFLKIDGIDGESTAQGYEKWINLISFNWATTTAGAERAVLSGAGAAAGRVSPQPFSFIKLTDSASPKIFAKMCQGSHFDKVSVACRAAGAAGEPVAPQDAFLKIDFSDVLFSAYNEGGNTATDPRPLESISFVFGSVEVQTVSQNSDGSAGDAITGGFDFQRRKAD